jgi:hypothetical protein
MGRKWRNRHRRQNVRFASDEVSDDGGDSGGNGRHGGGYQLGSKPDGGRSYTNDHTSHYSQTHHRRAHRPRELFPDHSICHQQPRNHVSTPCYVDQGAFILRSQRFKKQLLNSIDLTVKQLEQWFPDDGSEAGESEADEMDWQPEAEYLLPAPTERAIVTNIASGSTTAPATGLSIGALGIEMKCRRNSASLYAPLATRTFGGDEFGVGSAQKMERAMSTNKSSSVPSGCKRVVPTLIV